MRFGGRAAAAWRIPPPLLLLLSLLCTVALAKDKPDMSVTTFDHPPSRFSYFEDSDAVLFHDLREGSIYRSGDAGFSWAQVDSIPRGAAWLLVMHSFDSDSAFVLTMGTTHYKTEDRGETWSEFNSGTFPDFVLGDDVLVFHADDPKSIILNGQQCDGIFCDGEAAYTTDGFKTVDLLRGFTSGCWWARSSEDFTTGDADLDKTRTMCIVRDPFSFFMADQRLYISDSFFAEVDRVIQEFEPYLDTNKAVGSVSKLAVKKKYILVATSSLYSDEMALYVSDDTLKWHRAMFPADNHNHSHQITQEAYTILESTNYSIQVDVKTSHPSAPMGVLFTSNSNGTYFTENKAYTNRSPRGRVDFEQITGIQGIFLVNSVKNGPDVDANLDSKIVVTEITFDDGRTFESVKAGKDRIHLHSVTQLDNVGRVFSSPAPGLVMGNGNTGDSLSDIKKASLYVSDDAGETWRKALDGPHKHEFGDSGSVLVAVQDSVDEDVGEFSYSLDHGENWESVELPKGLHIMPNILTTTPDSTSLKFILVGENEGASHIIAIDFDGLHERTCGDGDMENWHARVDEDGNPTCIMGHKQTYRRRKKNADCFIKHEFDDPVPKNDDCECSDADFECDYNFERDLEDDSTCKPVVPISAPDGACKDDSDTFEGPSGWRLIPGNTCKRKDGKQKDDEVERKCSDVSKPPSQPGSGQISHTQFDFKTKYNNFEKIYLEKGGLSLGEDETLIARPMEYGGGSKEFDGLWLSSDHGKNWHRILEGENVLEFHAHSHLKDIVYFTTSEDKVIYTVDRGRSFHSFEPPTKGKPSLPLTFHPDWKDWLIWLGEGCEDTGGKSTCQAAYISIDRGDNWRTMLRYVHECKFIGTQEYKRFRPAGQILCTAREEESNNAPLTMMSSSDFFVKDKQVFEGEATSFVTMSEFILVRGEDKESDGMHALASMDGKHYEQVHFPYNFHETHESEYTVLDSSTHAVNLFVQTDGAAGRRHGSVIKSNSNGTMYVLSASNVNSDAEGSTDFEKVTGLEGVTLINVVTNVDKEHEPKELQTKISHNDGSEWGYLAPPSKDVDGNSYGCSSSNGDASCALHLHHYTEREDKGRTFSAMTAVGLLFGMGNVGSSLGDIKDADTFMSTDGGITWKNVKKGQWTWRYGDQGSIIVLVERATRYKDVKTNTVSYSVDEGETWQTYTFSEEEVTVLDLSTLKSGVSRNFLLWCRSGSDKMFTVNLDFSGMADRACELTDGDDSDYFLWSPKHPLQDDDCLFGHTSKYLRKKADRECYNDRGLQRKYEPTNCECSRRDYECAYNYELDNHGQCALVQGREPLSGQEWCENHPNETSWFEPTGYRRIPLSTCEGGNELDKTAPEHPCAGYEDEFERKHRTSGVAIFFAVVIPLGLAGAMGWYVYRNWSGKFGQIRLGEQSATLDSDQPYIKYPVVALSAVVAVVTALSAVAASLWRSATGTYERVQGGGGGSWFSSGPRRFTTRDSFARGRGDYATLDDDEGELLGEDSDDEV